eukprot:CAMPEP_0185599598 /NCGR_PEP_ID=MMETSP0434-20130131/82815_1 /TAXON_ID=626734 ORGANISM="Favella taraikaensis, Strain Fe Narragansett Bay" /NCGR_SAMPLE_ID=MMETSP0434 /ASSEMBLY_ACC=CAM_ASM_000379 /LENGTH=58 /DNA_ID=CAMNT_0028229057 /DNA_START=303 /DNA_END=479 /DNA_ORIENTATION=-
MARELPCVGEVRPESAKKAIDTTKVDVSAVERTIRESIEEPTPGILAQDHPMQDESIE